MATFPEVGDNLPAAGRREGCLHSRGADERPELSNRRQSRQEGRRMALDAFPPPFPLLAPRTHPRGSYGLSDRPEVARRADRRRPGGGSWGYG
jgi:hypothetical protein